MEPITGKAQQPQHGAGLVFIMGLTMLGLLVLHLVALWVWKALPCTRAKPVPEFLLFPVPELTLANLMVLPMAMASTLLLMQTESPRHQALGAVCALVILAYLGLVAAVLMAVSAKKELLGLKYVDIARQDALSKGSSDVGSQRTFVGCCSAHAVGDGDDNTNGMSALADDGCIRDSSAMVPSARNAPSRPADMIQSTSSTVLRFAPPHASGFWERADAAMQRELRLVYQGTAAAVAVHWAGAVRSPAPAAQRPYTAQSHLVRSVIACQAASVPWCPWCPTSGARASGACPSLRRGR